MVRGGRKGRSGKRGLRLGIPKVDRLSTGGNDVFSIGGQLHRGNGAIHLARVDLVECARIPYPRLRNGGGEREEKRISHE